MLARCQLSTISTHLYVDRHQLFSLAWYALEPTAVILLTNRGAHSEIAIVEIVSEMVVRPQS